MALIDNDKALVKKYNLTDVHELSKEDKVKFIDEQLEGIKTMIWRARVDAILNRGLKANNEEEENAIATKIREHERDVKNFSQAVTLLDQLKNEL